MQNDMLINDYQLTVNDIGQLENADEVARFFARLGYDIDTRTPLPDYGAIGLGNEDLRQQIRKIELIGRDPEDGDIIIYLLEVRSVTARLRNEIARRFRDRTEDALLVLTKEYEELEFVLLDRSFSRGGGRGLGLKQTVRPIPILVNRRHPDSIALRVLKRFTFTEADAAYQLEKLRSAFKQAETSAQYFINRALFSDYYLNERLRDPKLTPEWNADVRPVGRAAYGLIMSARAKYTRQPEAVIRAGMYEPLFAQLGFAFTAQKAGDSAADMPDYLLYAPGDATKPVAAALTYVWNRNLDDADHKRDQGGTPDEIPGAIVVSLLEAQVAPWVIVTNGKLWRLYSATASNKATNYYEIDLEEVFAAGDQLTALKYWWLMFRRPAFTGFLDGLLKNSAEYAKALGDRLKDRVFTEIFPQFARGFIADMQSKSPAGSILPLPEVFSGTMTFLYRLMFVLYAESLDLLPVQEARGYQELSMQRLKREIAAVGGTLRDESTGKLAAAYSATSTGLYQRLARLFEIIDQGSDELNMPTYNGGLFSPHGEGGAFLTQYAIPDRFLALGLDKLARDVDDRTRALVFIDFKSLGVRQLGSIYEGLLEFKLKLASEKLAVTKEKGKEVYQPFAGVKKPLAVIEPGDVYLENDKRERKATGSYYTPDYIVKYIVQHTVGPVLDRAFADLTPRLRAAQKNYRDAANLAAARQKSTGKPEDPATFWNNPAMQQLVDDCLNVRVVDPAMGSGHFLVEVVDYVSNRLISFLNGWSENPVWAMVERTREDILGEMERQRVTIDAERLTRVALLKRAVLKRCVYGVDLNLMAVELAKVSLWLDAFTLGAPLNFLDHHLKHGNSLIGARIGEVQTYVEAGSGETMDMFSGSRFAGVMLATDLMRQVSYLSDNTVAQAKASAAAYRDASDHLAPFKRLLDVYVSRWFGNQAAKKKSDYVRLFLQEPQTEHWLRDPATKLDNSLIPASQIATTATSAAAAKRFFHWELEFPEVFFAPATPGGQDVQLREDGGFDAVVGNPPYGQSNDKLLNEYAQSQFDSIVGKNDLYGFFVERAISELNPLGSFGNIVPHTWMTVNEARLLRKHIVENTRINTIVRLPSNIFDEATVETVLLFLQKNLQEGRQSDHSIIIFPLDFTMSQVNLDSALLYQSNQENYNKDNNWKIDIFLTDNTSQLLNRLRSQSNPIDSFFELSVGVQAYDVTRGQAKEIALSRAYHANYQKDATFRPEIGGNDVTRYVLEWSPDSWISYGPWLAAARTPKFFDGPRIIIREVTNAGSHSINATFTEDKYVTYKTVLTLLPLPAPSTNVDVFFSLALLNSSLLSWYFQSTSNKIITATFPRISLMDLRHLPIRSISFTTPAAERTALVAAASAAYTAGDTAGALAQTRSAIESGKTDVVHDLLAELAQRMIDLNKQKQAETKRFLGWLEGRLQIKAGKDGAAGVDSLPGKSILQNYFGDYQKNEPEQSWRDFFFRLHQNRNRFNAALSSVEGEIEQEYERSLAVLLPIKRDLARTDALIDKIVYRLYGLTDDEIELIERPQYQQALAEAKRSVVADETITDDDTRIAQIGENVLRAAEQFFARVEPKTDEDVLDTDLPGWRNLPPNAPTFLRTGEYNLRALPDDMDFSASVLPYTKAVEVTIIERIFMPFRNAGYDATTCNNTFLKGFMAGTKHLTLGNFGIILASSGETALRAFLRGIFPHASTQLYGAGGAVELLNDTAMRDLRNKAAHAEAMTREEAQTIRAWVLSVLALV